MADAALGGVMLDNPLPRTTQHSRGFEACDIITSDGSLIHVKRTPRSSAVSHLIGQALVATDTLRHDSKARQQLRDVVPSAGSDPSWLPKRIGFVTLGMARAQPITGDDLFSFSQVTLSRLDSSLTEADVKLTVAPIAHG